MKDRFEEHLRENREKLDAEEVRGEFIWEGVRLELDNNSYKKKIRVWQVAAAAMALLALGQFTFHQLRPKQEVQPLADYEPGGSFEAIEASYQSEVKALEQQVQSKNIDPQEYALLLSELEYVEEMEDQFRSDIPLVNDRERLAEILVDTYEKKIRLLERLLQQIDRNEERPEKSTQNTKMEI